MTMDYQLVDIKNLDRHTLEQIVTNEVNKLTDNKLCAICNKPFIDQDERDNAIVYALNPIKLVHIRCWMDESKPPSPETLPDTPA